MANMYYMLKGDAGAAGDGSTDDTTAVGNWLSHGISTGQCLGAEPGLYKVTSQVVLDLTAVCTKGLTIKGSGVQLSVFDGRSVTGSAPFLITNTNLTLAASDYLKIEDVGFLGNFAGPVLQVMKDDYSNNLDSATLDIAVGNSSTSTSAEGIRLNYVVQGDLKFVTNCSGHGTALRMRNTQFCNILVSCGNADVGIGMTDAFNFSNIFECPDIEGVTTACVQLTGTAPCLNTFLVGQWNYNNGGAGWDSSGGGAGCHDNYLFKPNDAPNGTDNFIKTGSVGYTRV